MVTEDGTEENMIDKIVDARRRGRGKQYLVRWVGYDRDHDEWLSGRIPKLSFSSGEGCKAALGPLPQPRTYVCFDAAITYWDNVYYALMTQFLLFHLRCTSSLLY